MAKTPMMTAVKRPKRFTDVLYIANEQQASAEIKWFLKQKKLSSLILSIDDFHHALDWLDMIGTVIIDTQGLTITQQQKLARTIESLEMNNIGVILLNNKMELPVKSFSLAPTKSSFFIPNSTETVSIDELWVRISVNLAYRKKSSKSSGIVVKPAVPPMSAQNKSHNKLAEQLHMTGNMVENLTEHLRLAGLVQRDFLPTQLPNSNKVRWVAVFLPAEWVSGDIYDIVRIDEEHIAFYLADAVGHSMPAALLTMFIKQALVMRQTAGNSYNIFSPAEVMSNLNVKMAEQRFSGYQFATCCYFLLNTKTLELTYARAGHPYPILIRPKAEPKQLEIRGSLLGVFKQAEYGQETIQLEPGDKLLLYSDGAEPIIGRLDDSSVFHYSEELYQIKDLPITDMFDKFTEIAKSKQVNNCEVDDVTAVGFEIL